MSVGTIMVGVDQIDFDPIPLVHVSVAAVRAEGVRIRTGWFSLHAGSAVQLVDDIPMAVLAVSSVQPTTRPYAEFLLFESSTGKPQKMLLAPGGIQEIELVSSR